MSETRKLAAILVADTAGSPARTRTLARLRGLRSDLIDPGSRRVTAASSSAPATARSWSSAAGSTPCAARSKFRIGVHLGDVIKEADGDLMGFPAYRPQRRLGAKR
jgi:adenylate cyclase